MGTFAAPGTDATKSEKPARPFGAPDSDADSGSDEEEGEEEAQAELAERALSPEKESEEKKRLKLQRGKPEAGKAWGSVVLTCHS